MKDASNYRLPWPAAVASFVVGISVVLLSLTLTCADRYPLADWNTPCRPCKCSPSGRLQSCDIPAELNVIELYLNGLGIQGIERDAFKVQNEKDKRLGHSLRYLRLLWLDQNNITTLTPDIFGSHLSELWYLSIENSGIERIETGAFSHGLGRAHPYYGGLMSLNLRDNQITSFSAGTLNGLKKLKHVFLDGNGIRELGNKTFSTLKNLEYVWLSGNEVNCSDISADLPLEAACLDTLPCGVESDWLAYLGWKSKCAIEGQDMGSDECANNAGQGCS